MERFIRSLVGSPLTKIMMAASADLGADATVDAPLATQFTSGPGTTLGKVIPTARGGGGSGGDACSRTTGQQHHDDALSLATETGSDARGAPAGDQPLRQ